MRLLRIVALLRVASARLLPLYTFGPDLVDSTGIKVIYAGLNWPGHMETMIPEGLQYRSVAEIVYMIKSLQMNVVRLTFATQMVDELLAGRNNAKEGYIRALGSYDGERVWQRILKNNGWPNDITRLQIYDAIAAELDKQGLMIHLDNHISKAEWCCNSKDGNSWFGDRFFDTKKWLAGWKVMVNHTKSWPALASVGLRNELRRPDKDPALKQTYNWETWTCHMRQAASIVHAQSPKTVIFLSGLNFDTDLSIVSTPSFRLSDWPLRKTALELHRYDSKSKPGEDCAQLVRKLDQSGWNVMDVNYLKSMPIVMTEFGFPQDGRAYKTAYAQCLKTFFAERQAGWIYWVLAGSYYKRSGELDFDEPWGILNHNWSDWRDSETVYNYFRLLHR